MFADKLPIGFASGKINVRLRQMNPAFNALFPGRKRGLIVVAILIPACFHALHKALSGIVGLAVDGAAVMTMLIYFPV